MSIHFDASRDRFVVRWTEAGRRRVRRFRSEADAIARDASLLSPARPDPDGASPRTLRRPHRADAAEPQDRPRLARGRPGRHRPARHAGRA